MLYLKAESNQPQEVCHASVFCRYIRHDHLLDSCRNGDRDPYLEHDVWPIGASSFDCNSSEPAHRSALRNVPGLDISTDESGQRRTSQERCSRHSGFRSLPSAALRYDSRNIRCKLAPDRNGLWHGHYLLSFYGKAVWIFFGPF